MSLLKLVISDVPLQRELRMREAKANFSSSLSCMLAWAFSADKPRHLRLPVLCVLLSSRSLSGVCVASEPDIVEASIASRMSATEASILHGRPGYWIFNPKADSLPLEKMGVIPEHHET